MKKSSKTITNENHWFSPKKIYENFKTIEWLPLLSKKDGTEGILKKFGAVVLILIAFALAFVVIDTLLTVIITYGGMNV